MLEWLIGRVPPAVPRRNVVVPWDGRLVEVSAAKVRVVAADARMKARSLSERHRAPELVVLAERMAASLAENGNPVPDDVAAQVARARSFVAEKMEEGRFYAHLWAQ